MDSSFSSRLDRRRAELLVAGSVLLATAGQVAIKLGLSDRPTLLAWSPQHLHRPFTAGVLVGLMIYSMGTILWLAAVSHKRISYLYPLASASYVLVALCGWLILGEHLRTGRWVGIAIMVFGILLLTSTASSEEAS